MQLLLVDARWQQLVPSFATRVRPVGGKLSGPPTSTALRLTMEKCVTQKPAVTHINANSVVAPTHFSGATNDTPPTLPVYRYRLSAHWLHGQRPRRGRTPPVYPWRAWESLNVLLQESLASSTRAHYERAWRKVIVFFSGIWRSSLFANPSGHDPALGGTLARY